MASKHLGENDACDGVRAGCTDTLQFHAISQTDNKKNCGFYFVMHQSDVGVRAHANLLV